MDRVGSNEKVNVKMYADSWFNLLFAIRKSRKFISPTQTYWKLGRDIDGKLTTVPDLQPINLDEIIKEVETQTGLTEGIDKAIQRAKKSAIKARPKKNS